MPLPNAWNPAHPAIWVEKAPGGKRAIGLRHATYPYEDNLTSDGSDALIAFAAGYLRKIIALFGLPVLLDPSTVKFVVPLAWLPVYVPEDNTPAPPHTSFWVRRYRSPLTPAGRIDRTVVILAAQSAQPNDVTQVLGSRLGIRIVAQVSPDRSAPWKARITSASCSIGLAGALNLYVSFVPTFFENFFGFERTSFRIGVKNRIRAASGLSDDTPILIDGLRVRSTSGPCPVLDVFANVPHDNDEPDAVAYALAAQLSIGPSGPPKVQILEKFALVADAGAPVQALVFPRDPASQAGVGHLIDARPNRAGSRLNRYRSSQTLPGLTPGSGGSTDLGDDLSQVEVRQSRLVDGTANENAVQRVVPSSITNPRMNSFAALSGYQHGRELWDTMRGYGLSPAQYSKFAQHPLRVRYRAPINPGPGKDGNTVNARVTYDPPDCDVLAVEWNGSVKPLQIRFALADLKRSASRREPLGIAADQRWSWHEYGHVLLGASTGALQLLFVHSVGDALAGIVADPDSALATHRRMRGLTFPWVYLHRRHDRDVFLGWSWSGRYHRPARFPNDGNPCRRKGYQSEQILSTSLFRLYRALGGDTPGTPGQARRRAAADYSVYLIMKAVGLLAPAAIMPIETPDQLVSALIDADIGTLPVTTGPLRTCVGGWAHKVVRWAFEAQGLYATTDPLAIIDKPGKPPDPDVFIDNGRPDSEGDYPRGGYMPVPLDWQPVPNPPSPPLWHAHANAIRVVGDKVTVVEVSTRGPSPANQVTVQVWWVDWPSTQPDPPPWNTSRWKSLGTNGPLPVPVWPAVATFGPFPSESGAAALPTAPSGSRLLIVATATCAADPANTDGLTALPCSTLPTPTLDLVAGDNNLGLRQYVIP